MAILNCKLDKIDIGAFLFFKPAEIFNQPLIFSLSASCQTLASSLKRFKGFFTCSQWFSSATGQYEGVGLVALAALHGGGCGLLTVCSERLRGSGCGGTDAASNTSGPLDSYPWAITDLPNYPHAHAHVHSHTHSTLRAKCYQMTAEKELHSSLKVTFYLCFIICSSPADHSSRCCNPITPCEPSGRGEKLQGDGTF